MSDKRPLPDLPAGASTPVAGAGQRLPAGSDWSFDLIETYYQAIREEAERFGLDT